jgi:hypothetical protein
MDYKYCERSEEGTAGTLYWADHWASHRGSGCKGGCRHAVALYRGGRWRDSETPLKGATYTCSCCLHVAEIPFPVGLYASGLAY